MAVLASKLETEISEVQLQDEDQIQTGREPVLESCVQTNPKSSARYTDYWQRFPSDPLKSTRNPQIAHGLHHQDVTSRVIPHVEISVGLSPTSTSPLPESVNQASGHAIRPLKKEVVYLFFSLSSPLLHVLLLIASRDCVRAQWIASVGISRRLHFVIAAVDVK